MMKTSSMILSKPRLEHRHKYKLCGNDAPKPSPHDQPYVGVTMPTDNFVNLNEVLKMRSLPFSPAVVASRAKAGRHGVVSAAIILTNLEKKVSGKQCAPPSAQKRDPTHARPVEKLEVMIAEKQKEGKVRCNDGLDWVRCDDELDSIRAHILQFLTSLLCLMTKLPLGLHL